MEPGKGQVGERLAQAAEAELVGRAREQAQLRGWWGPAQGPAVVFVSGSGGIGKSVLVRGTLAAADVKAVVLDGHDVEPTPEGVFRALGDALGGGVPTTPDEAAGALAAAQVSVLVVDAYERMNLVDGWLRNDLLVRLPVSITTVLVGRRPPNAAWRAAPGWRQLLAELVVGPLTDADALQLVERHPLATDLQQLISRFGRGHPLALELAAEAFVRHPDLELPDAPPAEVVEELFEVLLNDLTETDRAMVEAAAILRRVTQPLLAAVLADEHPAPASVAAAWRLLRGLPFVTTTSSGLWLHGVAHSAISGALEIRDPIRVQRLRRRAAVAVLHDAMGGHSWDATADLLFLVQNPIIRNSYVPPGDQQHPVEQAAADDLPSILAIAEKFDGPAGAELMGRWWRSHRDLFVVGRGGAGEVTAFSVVVRLSEVDPHLADADEVLQTFLDDVHRRPLADGEDCLLHRRALGARRGELHSPELGAMIIDIKRQYFQLRAVLARTYIATAHWSVQGPLLRSMGFAPFSAAVPVGQSALLPCVLEFGHGHVDGWLLRHILVETSDLSPPTAHEATATDASTSSAGDTSLAPGLSRLSAREREVVVVLAEGLTNTQIAERLFISERTANRHLSNIFTKLGVRNRTAAARIAIQAGLVG